MNWKKIFKEMFVAAMSIYYVDYRMFYPEKEYKTKVDESNSDIADKHIIGKNTPK